MTGLAVLVLAAGAAARMGGRDKLVEPVEGVPLLRLVTGRAAATGCKVYVTLPPMAEGRRAALDGFAATIVPVADASEGMGASLRAGVAALPEDTAVMVVLADMPEVGASDLRRLIAAWREAPERLVRAADADGRPGQPVIFPARLRPALLALAGDTGGREIVRGEDARLVTLEGTRATLDLDTPEDWAAWRARAGISR